MEIERDFEEDFDENSDEDFDENSDTWNIKINNLNIYYIYD